MDATLRVTPHQQDASVVNKEGVIEQQDNALETGFEMSNTFPVADDEALPLSESTATYLPETLESQTPQSQIASEHSQWFAGMEIAVDKMADTAPKSMQQTVEELSAASTRRLSASSMLPANHQLTALDSVKAVVDGAAIKGGVLSAKQTSAADPSLAAFQKQAFNATAVYPAFQRGEMSAATLNDLQPVNSVANNVTDPSVSAKTLQWAKVDLTATINNQHDKSLVSSQVGEKLNAILQDKINIQAANGIKTAQIRLDPPDMGHIKLIVAVEGDKVSVSMSAQNSMVREGLMQTSERLRNDLVNESFVNVAIDIDAGNGGSSGEDGNKEQQPETIANNFFVAKEAQLAPQDEFIVKI